MASHPSDLPRSDAPGAPCFATRLAEAGLHPFRAHSLEVLQLNLGYRCNLSCTHCHVSAGPARREVMTRRTMEACLRACVSGGFDTVDLTGGAPEMNPDFEWLLDRLHGLGVRVLVRTNLTILVHRPRYRALVDTFAAHRVHLVASLPCYSAANTDRQRGDGVFRDSIRALRILNRAGYGVDDALPLVLVYNPAGARLPPPAEDLEFDYRRELRRRYGVRFTRLITMANLPLGRTATSLRARGELRPYLRELAVAFNPEAAERVMCRSLISVGWDGTVYDCDFNQMLGIPVDAAGGARIEAFDADTLSNRRIVVGPHCFACAAGRGSSCGGALA